MSQQYDISKLPPQVLSKMNGYDYVNYQQSGRVPLHLQQYMPVDEKPDQAEEILKQRVQETIEATGLSVPDNQEPKSQPEPEAKEETSSESEVAEQPSSDDSDSHESEPNLQPEPKDDIQPQVETVEKESTKPHRESGLFDASGQYLHVGVEKGSTGAFGAQSETQAASKVYGVLIAGIRKELGSMGDDLSISQCINAFILGVLRIDAVDAPDEVRVAAASLASRNMIVEAVEDQGREIKAELARISRIVSQLNQASDQTRVAAETSANAAVYAIGQHWPDALPREDGSTFRFNTSKFDELSRRARSETKTAMAFSDKKAQRVAR